jgi:hypothetical protein
MAACSGLPQVTRLSTRMHYEDIYRLCYVRGPEGIIVELAERIG